MVRKKSFLYKNVKSRFKNKYKFDIFQNPFSTAEAYYFHDGNPEFTCVLEWFPVAVSGAVG